jgi:hypothetical protein
MVMRIDALATNGFLPGEWGGETVDCADHKCGRPVAHGDACFIEMQSSTVYCDACGKVKRYIRKKADQRAALESATNCME